MIRRLFATVLGLVIEALPGVHRADVTGDGDRELVVGPHPDSKAGRIFRHLGSAGISVLGLTVVVGVR